MPDNDRLEFMCDPKNIDWEPYLKNYIEGMAVWVLKEHKCSPEHQLDQLIIKDKRIFEHFSLSLQRWNVGNQNRMDPVMMFYFTNKLLSHLIDGLYFD